MKEKVLMLLACLWLGIGFSMAQAPKTVAGVVLLRMMVSR